MGHVNWFEALTGFREGSYDATKAQLAVDGNRLRSKVNGLTYDAGVLSTPSVRELREKALAATEQLPGEIKVSNVVGDVRGMHALTENRGALFQVASQFNLLEMTDYDVAPEDGVTRYELDRTQGPACAMAAGAATIFRNYFAKHGEREGQTRAHQIDCLADLGAELGNINGALWEMRNGYALCTKDGLTKINRRLEASSAQEAGALRDLLRIGVHQQVEVTDGVDRSQRVTQAFCSGLPVNYVPNVSKALWPTFARLVLEGAYEATVWAAVLNARRSGNPLTFLTMIGGDSFRNDPTWIFDAMRRALRLVEHTGLDVRIVSHREVIAPLKSLAEEFSKA